MIKKIKGQLWFCCPKCGKRIFPVQPGAVCKGILWKCKGKFPDGTSCGWSGEISIEKGA